MSTEVTVDKTLAGTLRTWYRAARPFTLSAAVAPILVGSAVAFQEGQAILALFILMLVASLLVQAAANLVDEYSDHGRPEGRQKLLAPYKVIATGQASSQAVKLAFQVCFALAGLIALYLVLATGWPLLVICVASAVAAYLYSGGPRPLGSIGLGHPLVFFFMGPIMVVGSYYVHTLTFGTAALMFSIPIGCTVTAILVANDLRDLEEDDAGGKATPITLFGRSFGRWEWTLLVCVAFLIVVIAVATSVSGPLALISLLAAPEAYHAGRAVWRGQDRPELAHALRATSRFHLIFGGLLALGLTLERFV